MEGSGVSRISISLPEDLLKRFDETIERIGYESRSKAVQDAIQNLITESKWMCEKMGNGTGALAMVYDHTFRGVEEEMTEIQHQYADIITSSMHIHLDSQLSMEIIAVKGDAWEIRDLAQELRTRRGVKQLKPAIVTP